jgi:hypothetical protein
MGKNFQKWTLSPIRQDKNSQKSALSWNFRRKNGHFGPKKSSFLSNFFDK